MTAVTYWGFRGHQLTPPPPSPRCREVLASQAVVGMIAGKFLTKRDEKPFTFILVKLSSMTFLCIKFDLCMYLIMGKRSKRSSY